MTEREIMKLAKDIVMYFDGLQMCGETTDVLIEQIMNTYFALKEGNNNDVWWALDDREADLLKQRETEHNDTLKRYMWFELKALRALKDRVAEIV